VGARIARLRTVTWYRCYRGTANANAMTPAIVAAYKSLSLTAPAASRQ